MSLKVLAGLDCVSEIFGEGQEVWVRVERVGGERSGGWEG